MGVFYYVIGVINHKVQHIMLIQYKGMDLLHEIEAFKYDVTLLHD